MCAAKSERGEVAKGPWGSFCFCFFFGPAVDAEQLYTYPKVRNTLDTFDFLRHVMRAICLSDQSSEIARRQKKIIFEGDRACR